MFMTYSSDENLRRLVRELQMQGVNAELCKRPERVE